MKPKPASSMHVATTSGPRSMRAPSASSRSADPDRLVAERFPCLATAQPAPAAISAAVVDTLKLLRPPPVPAVSSRSCLSIGTRTASSRIVRARPASSWTVSPFVRSAIRKPAIWVSEASPCMISESTSEVRCALRSRPEASSSIAPVRISLGIARPFSRLPAARDGPLGSGGHPAGGEEVAEQLAALFGEHGLGVELHPLGGQHAVAQAHQDPSTASGLLQAVRKVPADHQRVVAGHRQRRGQTREDRTPVVLDRAGLAVHGRVQLDASAEGLRERLM